MSDGKPADGPADPVAEAKALSETVRQAKRAVLAGERVDLAPIGERVAALTWRLNDHPPEDPAEALAAREGLGEVVRALDALETALAAQAPGPAAARED